MICPCNQSFSSREVTKEGCGEGCGFLPSAAKKPPGDSCSPVPSSTPWDVTDPQPEARSFPVSIVLHIATSCSPDDRPLRERTGCHSHFTENATEVRVHPVSSPTAPVLHFHRRGPSRDHSAS